MTAPHETDAMSSIPPFLFQSHSQRVLFGAGTLAQVGDELDALGARKALVLCTPPQRAQAEHVADLLGARAAGIFDGAVMHVPMSVAREARDVAARLGADCAVAIGGGSTIGLGKAIALDSGLPIVAVPTTYAGSEMTPIYGLTEHGEKRTGKDVRVLPRTVIYDPELTLKLPVAMSVTSGINALAHAAEGLYAVDGNPVMRLLAEEGIAALGRALPGIRADAGDVQARGDALYGAWLCGKVLGSVGMALHHKLCHVLGGSFDLPHAETHAIVLPHALAYNAGAAGDAMARIARALHANDAPRAVYALAERNGAPVALKAIGMREQDLDRACALAVQNPYPNPRPLEASALRRLLQNAFDGVPPQAA
jgi:maleylacetate reductase